MDSTHLHLLLSHFPIIGILMGTALLLYGVWSKKSLIREISLATIIVMSLISIPVFITGEPAEETVENIPGVMETIVEEHEEAAEIAFWMMMGTAAVSLVSIAFGRMRKTPANALVMVSLVLGIITSGMLARTGYLGGQIRHSEIRGEVTGNPVADMGGNEDREEDDDDDDEHHSGTFLKFGKDQ